LFVGFPVVEIEIDNSSEFSDAKTLQVFDNRGANHQGEVGQPNNESTTYQRMVLPVAAMKKGFN
jgi:hypothetical protein